MLSVSSLKARFKIKHWTWVQFYAMYYLCEYYLVFGFERSPFTWRQNGKLLGSGTAPLTATASLASLAAVIASSWSLLWTQGIGWTSVNSFVGIYQEIVRHRICHEQEYFGMQSHANKLFSRAGIPNQAVVGAGLMSCARVQCKKVTKFEIGFHSNWSRDRRINQCDSETENSPRWLRSWILTCPQRRKDCEGIEMWCLHLIMTVACNVDERVWRLKNKLRWEVETTTCPPPPFRWSSVLHLGTERCRMHLLLYAQLVETSQISRRIEFTTLI